jgi:hypothetical protein
MTTKTIWKYILCVAGRQTFPMPDGAQVLSVQMQGNDVCMWAMVDPRARKKCRTFHVFCTGHEISDPYDLCHVGTVQDFGGSPLVFHVFEDLAVRLVAARLEETVPDP